jgi:hypothetical protein
MWTVAQTKRAASPEMDPVKVAGVASWPTPENKKDVQQFLGFTKFYRRFIWAFSDIYLLNSTCFNYHKTHFNGEVGP